MKFLLLVFLALIQIVQANGIDTLLEDYKVESDFSHKTKDESAGILTVYTRDDLERMQVESLKDLLKSLRINAYIENRMAQPDIINIDPLTYNSKAIRVYLNEHELLTALTGSGLILFGDMELDFIDHVEIYQGFPSFEFGIEPATTVIRLYSKTALHDEGGRVKVNVGSNGRNKQNVYYANRDDDLSYFFYANRTDSRLDTYKHDDQTLKRDKTTSRFFASLTKGNHNIEFHAMNIESDAFLGSIPGATPRDTEIDTSYLHISSSSKFLNDTLKFNMSYIKTKSDLEFNYDNNLFIPGFNFAISDFKQNIPEESFTSSLSKKWDAGANTLTMGLQYRYKNFDLTDFNFNNYSIPATQAFDTENIYSAYLEDSYGINEKNRVTLSAMIQQYQRNGDRVKDITTTQLRLAYIFTNNEWLSKTFLSSQEFAPDPYTTLSPGYGNLDLKSDRYNSIIEEISFNKNRTLTKLILFYGENEDTPYIVQTNPYQIQVQNTDEALTGYGAALEFTLHFRDEDKLELQVNYFSAENPYQTQEDYTSWTNYVARMINNVGKFDFYNELVINYGYTGVDTGYNYSLGVKYEITKDFHVNLKGDNIFDTGLTHKYYIVPGNTVEVPTIEQSFFAGIEYLF